LDCARFLLKIQESLLSRENRLMSTVFSNAAAANVAKSVRVPPLHSGDRLTRDEFERRYQAMPRGTRAELVKGIVYVMVPPVTDTGHSNPHGRFTTWLGTYEAFTPGTHLGDNGTIRLDGENEYQPDSFLLILPAHGGQCRASEDDYIEGAPELIAEVAASSASYDLHDKLELYERHGVQEYIVWRTWDRVIEWFELREGKFARRTPDEHGIIKSRSFPGLWLDTTALLNGQPARVLTVLQQGLASPEHQAFVAWLQTQRK
jgi:Uma2 family endonuclease